MVKPFFINKKNEKKPKEQEVNKIKFLSKKREEPDNPKPDVDMITLKKKVNEIMYSICNEKNNSLNELDKLYESMSKDYLSNEFTSNCLNYINKIILNAPNNGLKKFQGTFELNKIFISIVKELLINEFELLLLSLYLETLNISCQDLISFKESLIFICFFIKKLTLSEEKLSPINSFLNRKYQGFSSKFNIWLELNSAIFNKKLFFEYLEINERFKEFNKPYSIFCKSNYLDYNLIIDRILKMSIPYSENKNENIYINKRENNTNNKKLGYDNIFNNQFNIFSNNKNNPNFFTNNDNINFTNNFNYLNNYISNNIIPYPGSIDFNQNNKNTNLDYSNIFSSLNLLNNGQNNNENLINQNVQDIKKKGNIKFNVIKENNYSTVSNTGKNESNETFNQKLISVTKSQNNNTEEQTINENQKNKIILNDKNIKNNDNNQFNIFQQKNSNNNISSYPNNNILIPNISQQINDYVSLKYNNNLGINNINSESQISLISLNNNLMSDLNNLLNNSFHKNNFSQLLSHSNEDFDKNCLLTNNADNSSNNLNNYNLCSNENNINNNNYSFITNLINNTCLQNLNIIQQDNSNIKDSNNENNLDKNKNNK